MVEQLLQTPSMISVLSLLMNSEAHREVLERVLEQAYVEHDVTMDQFDHIVANITSCNNLSFCDGELPEEGRNHNLALHILMNCKEDALSNMLVDTGSSLNVLPKSTLSKLTYQGTPMRYSGVIIKAFDGSRKTVIGEVDLLVKICPSDFQITFQVMDIHPAYSCLLGRPWIHEAGTITSTLHQKLKFVKNGKLVIVGGEKTLLVSHLSSFSYVEVEDEVGTMLQALSIAEVKKIGAPMSSFKDAQKIIEDGSSDQWCRMVEVAENMNRVDLGFQRGLSNVKVKDMQPSFHEDCTNFVTHGKACHNWIVVDVPVIVHRSRLVSKPIKYNDLTPSPNIEFLVFNVEEEIDEEVSDELSRLLEHEEKAIQPFEEHIELVNLGSEDDVKEVKIGSQMCPEVKKRLIDLLRECSDVFAWSYQDMPGSDSEILEHRLSLKLECPPVKQKLRKTHPDMAVKIK
ncbi:hypothetical protein KIW84_024019 [Lathyrus oleraceus]|uniref:Uncharacterized protein n=1 Tax=Pisum sativum TaxID=3888 RepID=A0A9D4YIA6_PEA|nr:hypothetical protein KIW84_024019 [Pisum sativum]